MTAHLDDNFTYRPTPALHPDVHIALNSLSSCRVTAHTPIGRVPHRGHLR